MSATKRRTQANRRRAYVESWAPRDDSGAIIDGPVTNWHADGCQVEFDAAGRVVWREYSEDHVPGHGRTGT